MNIRVFSLVREESPGNETEEGEFRVVARLVRRPLCKHKETLNVNFYESHFSYIKKMNMYSQEFPCPQ